MSDEININAKKWKCPHCKAQYLITVDQDVVDGEYPDSMNTTISVEEVEADKPVKNSAFSYVKQPRV